jgi:hypothetical protein
MYQGERITTREAKRALTFGILGLFVCGVLFGVLAIATANSAKRAIASDDTLGGERLANAAIVLGIVDIIAWVILMLVLTDCGAHLSRGFFFL